MDGDQAIFKPLVSGPVTVKPAGHGGFDAAVNLCFG
jgi:hypothetical protein